MSLRDELARTKVELTNPSEAKKVTVTLIQRLRAEGVSDEEIGRHLGVSSERVQQYVERYG